MWPVVFLCPISVSGNEIFIETFWRTNRFFFWMDFLLGSELWDGPEQILVGWANLALREPGPPPPPDLFWLNSAVVFHHLSSCGGKRATRVLGRVRSDLPHIRKQDENLWVTSKFDGLQVIFSMLHPPLTASRVNSCLYKQVEIDGRNLYQKPHKWCTAISHQRSLERQRIWSLMRNWFSFLLFLFNNVTHQNNNENNLLWRTELREM